MNKMSSPFFVYLLSLLFASTINLTHSFPTFSSKVTSDQLKDICSRAKNPSMCFSALNSDPQTATTDLKGLCKISIDLTRVNAEDTFNAFGMLVKSTTDPTVKAQYATCYDYYDEAIGALLQAAQSLATDDYNAVQAAAVIVEKEAADCASEIANAPGDIKTRNQNMEALGSAVESVAAYILRV